MLNVIVSGKLDEAKSLEILQERVRVLVDKEWRQCPEFRDLLRLFKEVSIRIVFGENQKKSEASSDVLSWPISDPRLDFSVRTRNCLQIAKIHNLQQLVQRSQEDLLNIMIRMEISALGELIKYTADELLEHPTKGHQKNFGPTSLNEIRKKLHEKGLKLKGD